MAISRDFSVNVKKIILESCGKRMSRIGREHSGDKVTGKSIVERFRLIVWPDGSFLRRCVVYLTRHILYKQYFKNGRYKLRHFARDSWNSCPPCNAHDDRETHHGLMLESEVVVNGWSRPSKADEQRMASNNGRRGTIDVKFR